MRVYGLNAIGVATEIEHVESVEWSDVTEVGRDTVRVTAPPTNSNLTLRPDRIILIATESRGMLFGPYDTHAETSAGEVGMLTWTGSKGRRYNETYAEQEGDGAALEAITEQLGIWTVAIDPWVTWGGRPATSLDRMLALIFAQTYQTSSLASMRDVLERWGLSLTVDLQQTGVNVAAGVYPIRVEILPLYPIDATPRKRRAVVVDIGDDGLPASNAQANSARIDPVPLTLPVDADATQVETPDVWNRPGAYTRRRIVAARQSLGFGVEVLYESHAASLGADPTIYLQDVTAEDFALQLAENERWRLQNTAQSARIRQAVPYWSDAIVDELTLQPLDLVSIDGATLRVESVEHEWSATTGYLRTLNCWLWQGYFGEMVTASISPAPRPMDPDPAADPVVTVAGRTSIAVTVNQPLLSGRTSWIVRYVATGSGAFPTSVLLSGSNPLRSVTLSGLMPDTEYTILVFYGGPSDTITLQVRTLP